jgi:hypothetical protein
MHAAASAADFASRFGRLVGELPMARTMCLQKHAAVVLSDTFSFAQEAAYRKRLK